MKDNIQTIFRYALKFTPVVAMAFGVPLTRAITLQGMVESGSTISVKPLPHVPITLLEATTSKPNQVG